MYLVKTIFTTFLVTVVSANTDIDLCSSATELNVYQRHPLNCNKFYTCQTPTRSIIQTCPANLLYNEAGFCDWPQNVDCSTKTTESTTPKPIFCPPSDYLCPPNVTLMKYKRHPADCTRFYVCLSTSQPAILSCPHDLYLE